ncbi:phage integrase family site-specific recombinase [Klebsiella pneumoniae]|nr:phage integrase family site-specific recombinase [Klebsiella pneumoniae]
MALTDAKIRAAKPQEKPYKLADSGNMFLLVHPNGSRYWRLRYRFQGKKHWLWEFILNYPFLTHVIKETAHVSRLLRVSTLVNRNG